MKKLKIVGLLLPGVLSLGIASLDRIYCDPPADTPAPAKPVKPTPPKK